MFVWGVDACAWVWVWGFDEGSGPLRPVVFSCVSSLGGSV